MTEAPTTLDQTAPLFAEVITVQEAALLRQELETLHEALFQADTTKLEKSLQESVRARVAALVEQLWRNAQATAPNKQQEVVDHLIQELKDLPILRLTLAFEPTRIQLLHWREWLAKEFQQFARPVLFELSYDPAIIGGAVVMWEGQYRDFSLRKKLKERSPAWQEKMHAA